MKSKRIGGVPVILLVVISALFGGSFSFGLNCKEISQMVGLFNRLHYSVQEFDDQLSEETLEGLFESLDPSKMYFLKSDIEGFRNKYAKRIDDLIRQGDCSALNDVLHTYAKRFEDRQETITMWIDFEHDYSVDEEIDLDLKKRDYVEDVDALVERWRKQIKFQYMRLKKTFKGEGEAREKLKKRYELNKKYLEKLNAFEIASIFLNAFSTRLDPHSKYFSPNDLEDFRISTGLSLEGIGATLSSDYGVMTIRSLIPGGPAKKSGLLKIGDRILAVGQGSETPVDIVDMRLRNAVKHIRGQRGTEVRLTIERDAGEKTQHLIVPIIRDKIELKDKEAKGFTYVVEVVGANGEVSEHRVGFIDLPSFYIDFEGRKKGVKDFTSSSADLKRIINELKEEDIEALIIDLRYNSGGSLDEAVDIAGLFFDTGPVVQVVNTGGKRHVLSDRDKAVFYDGPLAVMINQQSASSSEILAGAIQDYGRGIIVGNEHTFGKGTVQTVKQIPPSDARYGAIKTTISQFFRPGGSSTQVRGVGADIRIPDLLEELEIGEKYNDTHLPWASIEPADFNVFGKVRPYLEALKKSSEARVSASEDFKKVSEEIDKYREKKLSRYIVSLKEESEEDGSEAEGEDDSEKKEGSGSEEADEEDLASKAAKDAEEDTRPSLERDIILRETLAIVADYVQLLENKELGEVRFPELRTDTASNDPMKSSEVLGNAELVPVSEGN